VGESPAGHAKNERVGVFERRSAKCGCAGRASLGSGRENHPPQFCKTSAHRGPAVTATSRDRRMLLAQPFERTNIVWIAFVIPNPEPCLHP
jgi:hypothetical protein